MLHAWVDLVWHCIGLREMHKNPSCEEVCGLILMALLIAFIALTLLVEPQEEHPASKIGVMMCWHGYLSGSTCTLFAYGLFDTTIIPKPHHLLLD